MKSQTLALSEIKERGMKALVRELGPAGMAQFMQQFAKGYGDYTKDRHRILDKFSVDEIFDEMHPKKRSR